MAVPEQTPYIEHTGNGATTSFALKFKCESKDHLIVLVDEVEPPIATWSLSGGNVVFTTAPAAGKKITLQRNTPFSRTTDYQSYNNSFRPPAVNQDFDWIWLKLQELGVADWILGARIDALKNYVDRKDDELKAYLMEEIRKQGVALDQLDEYYNYLMQRLAQIAVDKGWDASFVVDASGKNQQEVNNLNLYTVKSVNALQLLTPIKKGQKVYLESYIEGVGAGGGVCVATQKSGLTPNDITVFSSPNPLIFWVRSGFSEISPDMAGADGTVAGDTAACKKIFSLARTQPISMVLERMYKINEPLACYYVQTHNKAFSLKGRTKDTGFDFVGSMANQYIIDIHGYHAEIANFRLNEQTNHANTNIGMRYCGEDISVDGIVARGYFKKVVLGVAALKSKFSNLDIQTADNTDENFVGIGLQLAACVNTDLTGTSYIGRTDCPVVTGLLDGETYEALKPPSLLETITWNCEGIGIEGVKSVKSNTGMILKGLEIQVSRCISDFNKFKFFTLEGQLIKITDSWFACDTNTPANQEMIGSTGTGCAYATLTNNTFDSGQATANGQTATFDFPFSTYIANMSSYIACTINAQNEALCLFNKHSITGGTPGWVINNLSDNSIVLPRAGKSKFANGISLGKNAPTTNSKLAIRIDGGETALEIVSALGTILSTCEGGLNITPTVKDNNNILKVGHVNSSMRSIAATGTINASGADYAEYMTKSEGCGVIKAGDICGIDSNGLLTDKYDESISFVIKSTNPSYVGGDTWSNIPNYPTLPDEYTDDEYVQYVSDVEIWEDAYNEERAKYDRIAFCGQVPVNVLGGKSGDYLVPMKLESGSIGGYYVSSPSFEEFMGAVGKVITGNIVKVVMH